MDPNCHGCGHPHAIHGGMQQGHQHNMNQHNMNHHHDQHSTNHHNMNHHHAGMCQNCCRHGPSLNYIHAYNTQHAHGHGHAHCAVHPTHCMQPPQYMQSAQYMPALNDKNHPIHLHRRIAFLETELNQAQTARFHSFAPGHAPRHHGNVPGEGPGVYRAILERICELEQAMARLSPASRLDQYQRAAADDEMRVYHRGEFVAENNLRDAQPGHGTVPEPTDHRVPEKPKAQGRNPTQEREKSPLPRFINHFQHQARVEDAEEDEASEKESVLSESLSLGNPKRAPGSARPVLVSQVNAAAVGPEPSRAGNYEMHDSYPAEVRNPKHQGFQDVGIARVGRGPGGPGPLVARRTEDGKKGDFLVALNDHPSRVDDPATPCDDLPSRTTGQYRTILMRNIPTGTPIGDVTRRIRGGKLISAELTKTPTDENGKLTARIVFMHEAAARRYLTYRSQHPLLLSTLTELQEGHPPVAARVHIAMLATRTSQLNQRYLMEIIERGATRCLLILNFPSHLSMSHIYAEFSDPSHGDIHGIESTHQQQSSRNRLQIFVTFTSVDRAAYAKARINNFRVLGSAMAFYVPDECAGAVEDLHEIEGTVPVENSAPVARRGNQGPLGAPRETGNVQKQSRPYSPPDFSRSFMQTSRGTPAYRDWDAAEKKKLEKVSGDELDYGEETPVNKPLRLGQPPTSIRGVSGGGNLGARRAVKKSESEMDAKMQQRGAPVDYSDLHGGEGSPGSSKTTGKAGGAPTPAASDEQSAKPDDATTQDPEHVILASKDIPSTAHGIKVQSEIKSASPEASSQAKPATSNQSPVSNIDISTSKPMTHESLQPDGETELSTKDPRSNSPVEAPGITPRELAFRDSYEAFKRMLEGNTSASGTDNAEEKSVDDVKGEGGAKVNEPGAQDKEAGEVGKEDRDKPGDAGTGRENESPILDY